MPVAITVEHAARRPEDVDLVVVGVRKEELDGIEGLDVELAELAGFTAGVAQTRFASTAEGHRLLVGLGEDPEPDDLRRVGAAVARAASKHQRIAVEALASFEGPERVRAAGSLAEGLALGSYSFTDYKDPDPAVVLGEAVIVSKGGKKLAASVARAAKVADAVGLVRDLVNTPGGEMTPDAFAEVARDLAAEHGLELTVWGRDEIVAEGLGGLAGVARGSTQEPRYLKITHRPADEPRARIALVGKGVTFDSGGLSIKSSAGLDGMKGDMAGAAAVLGAMTLVSELAPRLEVTAHLPLTDNMLGGDATRVGDVLRIRDTTTVEVLNTDAEGRLILADALCLAAEDAPDAIIDLATLTGACMVALGDRTAGLMANDTQLADRVLDAAHAAGEDIWALPLPEHLEKSLESSIADVRNIGTGSYGGALTAGLFLRRFVAGLAWVHLDIAGPASSSSQHDEISKGGTGFGVRTLAELLRSWPGSGGGKGA